MQINLVINLNCCNFVIVANLNSFHMRPVANINNYIANAGIKPSHQRIQIMKYLYGNTEHPTVEKIYTDLKKEISTLSKTTVYNTLNLFAEKGIVAALLIGDSETHYDYNTKTHGHYRCKQCGEVSDFFFDEEKLNVGTNNNFNTEKIHIYIEGKCMSCQNLR